MATQTASDSVLEGLGGILGEVEALYKDVHGHPELSMQEERTADVAADFRRFSAPASW